MTRDLNPIPGSDFGSLAIHNLLPERPALIGEFSPAYVAFREAALRLAIAEARYHRTLHKVDTHDTEPNSAQQVANKLHADVRFVLDGLPERVADGPADPFDLEYAEFGLRQVEKLLVEVGRSARKP